MRFKVDENLPLIVAQHLRDAGHDAITVVEQNMVGAKDATLAEVCQNEQRCMITLDLDFADIRTYPPGDFAGLVVLRLRRHDEDHIAEVLDRILPRFDDEPLNGQLWVVDERGVRIRGETL